RIHVPESEGLRSALARLAQYLQPQVCIETGTYDGTGSTRYLIELANAYRIGKILTVEVSPSLHGVARRNLASFPFVECIWGLTLPKSEAVAFIENDNLLAERGPEPDIYIDFLPDPVGGYLRELEGALGGDTGSQPPDDVLGRLVPSVRTQRPLF